MRTTTASEMHDRIETVLRKVGDEIARRDKLSEDPNLTNIEQNERMIRMLGNYVEELSDALILVEANPESEFYVLKDGDELKLKEKAFEISMEEEVDVKIATIYQTPLSRPDYAIWLKTIQQIEAEAI